MPNHYFINQRDLEFLLFEQLRIQTLAETEAFGDFERDDYAMIIGEAIRFATEAIAPLNQDSDRVGATFADGEVTTPPGFIGAYKQTAQNGWIGAAHSPKFGGMGLPMVMGCVLNEIFLGACTSFQLNMGLTSGVGHLVESFGTPEQQAMYAERLFSGTWTGTMVLTEPGAGSHLADVRTTAEPVEGEDYFLIQGGKMFISAGEHDLTENIIHAVLAKMPGGRGGTKALGLFLVPKFIPHDDGSLGERNDLICAGIEHKMGIHGSPTCVMNFGENGACKGWLLGSEPYQGMRQMFQLMNEARIMTGMQGVALTGVAYENSRRFARDRIQGLPVKRVPGGSPQAVPIIQHGDVRRMLMLQKCHLEGLRALAYYAATLVDREVTAKDADDADAAGGRLALLTPVVKAFCSDKGFEMCSEAIQVHGGYGYCGEYPVEQYTRDARIAALYEGTNYIQAADLLGRKLPMAGGAPLRALLEEIGAWAAAAALDEVTADIAAALSKAHAALEATTMQLTESTAGGDFEFAMSVATRYLHMFGEVLVGWLLGQQAQVATAALEAGADGDDVDFYKGKVLTARFYALNVLPFVNAKAAAIQHTDTSLFKMPDAVL
jgi:alkylation response protein AidB-like acyl-CoA dehydrogenase